MKKRFTWTLLLTIFLIITTAASSVADQELMEGDEYDGSNPPLSQIVGLVFPDSPFHANDGATNANEWVPVNSQYNEPRNGARGWTHAGVDLASKLNDTHAGRLAYGTYTGTVATMRPDNGDAFGNYVETSHYYRVDLMTYKWKIFYAHLNSFAPGLTVGQSMSRTTLIGTTGDKNLGCTTPCVHLHLEIHPLQVVNTNGGFRSLSPNLLFNSQTSGWNNGLDQSFITRTGLSGNLVTFRLTVKTDPGTASIMPNPPYSNVTFWYKNTSGTWVSTTNWTTVSGDSYTMDLKSIRSSGSIEYYVAANNAGYDGQMRGPAFRPWRHGYNNPAAPPPTDRPFVTTIL